MLKLSFCIVFLFSCTTKVIHGVIIEEKTLQSVIPNVTRMEDVKNLFGSPSFIIEDIWYYARTVKNYRAFFIPKVEKHTVYAITFENQTVSKIEHFNENDIQTTPVPTYTIKTTKPNLTEIYNAN